jgi:hypothetical protein
VNEFLCLLIGVVIGWLTLLPVAILALRRVARKQLKEIAEMRNVHEQRFSDLVNRMNHEGMIPHLATATGLLNLILWAVSNSIVILETLYANKDWNTKDVISNLRGIAMVELSLLHKKLGDFLEAKRNVLRDFDEDRL